MLLLVGFLIGRIFCIWIYNSSQIFHFYGRWVTLWTYYFENALIPLDLSLSKWEKRSYFFPNRPKNLKLGIWVPLQHTPWYLRGIQLWAFLSNPRLRKIEYIFFLENDTYKNQQGSSPWKMYKLDAEMERVFLFLKTNKSYRGNNQNLKKWCKIRANDRTFTVSYEVAPVNKTRWCELRMHHPFQYYRS